MLITDGGKVIRMPVRGISVIGRNTQGVRLIDLAEGEKVVGVACLADRMATRARRQAPSEPGPDASAVDERGSRRVGALARTERAADLPPAWTLAARAT